MSKALLWVAALALVADCMFALQPQKAYAATTITEVGVTVDFDAIPMNCATTGNEANEAFKGNRGPLL